MTDPTTEAQAIIDALSELDPVRLVEPGCIYAVRQPGGGFTKLDLTGDEYLDEPRRKRGHVTTADVASFAQYHGKHATPRSEVFTDLDAATITAVLDAHDVSEPGWQQHRLTLTMRRTPQWMTWTSQDRQLMVQQSFAEFLEDNAADIAPDGPVSAADLIELAQEFHAHTKVQFSSGKRLASGQTQFVYHETTEAKGGNDRGTIAVPDEFHLALAPIEDCDHYRVRARFRYRLADGQLLLGYHLDDPAGKLRQAVSEIVEKTEHACGVTIMRGTP